MIQVECSQVGHQQSLVQALCLREDCKNSSACCVQCMQQHPDCANHLKSIEAIPEQLSQLNSLRDWFRDKFDQIKKLILRLEDVVNQHFRPIDEYTHSQTLTNLNRLGQMMKDQKQLDKQKQMMCKDLDIFKDMFFNQNGQQMKQVDPVVVLSFQEKRLVQKYFLEAIELLNDNEFQKAIECFDKVLQIDKEHFESLLAKFGLLFDFQKYEEAQVYFDQCIKLDPENPDLLPLKGRFLLKTKKYEEAIKCFDEEIKIDPIEIDHYCRKGKSLGKLLRLKDAEQCYIEGLKHNPNNDFLKQKLSTVQEEMKKQQ